MKKRRFNERYGNHTFLNWYIYLWTKDGAEKITAARLTLLYILYVPAYHWQAVVVISGKNEMQLKLDNAMEDVNNKYLALEMAEKNAVRTALIEERSRFCFFISYLRPFVVRNECLLYIIIFTVKTKVIFICFNKRFWEMKFFFLFICIIVIC